MAASYRVVLQTGASAGISRVFAVAFTLGAALAAGLVGLMLWAGDLPFPHVYVLPIVPVAFMGVSVFAHVATWRSRATDLRVGPDGVRVEGGPHAGLTLRWADIEPDATRLETNPNVTVTIDGETTPERRLILARKDAPELTLAVSTDPDEQRSLAAVVRTLRDAGRPVEAPEDEGPADVVRCASCAAPLAPVDADEGTCWRCGRSTPVPEVVRSRVRAQAERDSAREEVDRALVVVLRQPGAARANAWLAASLLGPYLLPVALCAAPGPWNAWLALVIALTAASNLAVARRAAFHRLSVVFAARPAEAPGAPLRCRSCAGPLPTTADATVACPWCEAVNVRAVQLDRPAAALRDAAQDLAAFVADQRARVRWRRVVLGFWLALAIGSFFLPSLE